MLDRGWQQLKSHKKSGVSMAIVLCVSAFFIAFAAAILYTAGLLTAQSNMRLKEEKCYQLASSFGKVLSAELTKYDQKNDSAANGSFYAFSNKFLDNSNYVEYNVDYEDTTKYRFLVSGSDLKAISSSNVLPQGYGNLLVTLRKEQNASESMSNLKDGTLDIQTDGNYTTQINDLENITVRQYVYTVDVTAYVDDLTYTYTTEYTREEKYKVSFTYKNQEIVWDGNNWRYGNTSGEICTPSVGDADKIQYTYLSDTTSCRYVENTYSKEVSQNASE